MWCMIFSHHRGGRGFGVTLRGLLLLLVLFLGFSVPLFGESLNLEGVTLSPQEWRILQDEYSGLKNDLTELQRINNSQMSLVNELESLQKNNEMLMNEQKILLIEQQSELDGLKISSERLIADIKYQETLISRWRVGALVGGGVALALGVTLVIVVSF